MRPDQSVGLSGLPGGDRTKLNAFDTDVLLFLNQFAHHSRVLDLTARTLAVSPLAKGGLVIAAFWWVWFWPGDTQRNRKVVIAALVSAVTAVIAGRLLALYLPFRLRPIHAPELGFVLPYGATQEVLRGWSSFPSDHAMAFFAASTGLWFISRRLGAILTIYVALFVARRAGAAGRAGNTVGTYICADLACSLYLRGLREPEVPQGDTAATEVRVERLGDRLETFVKRVLA